MADLAKEQGKTDLPNKYTNAKLFLDQLFDTYVGSDTEQNEFIKNRGQEMFNVDKSEEAVIKHITKELDNERQKNQMLSKSAQKTVELKSKEKTSTSLTWSTTSGNRQRTSSRRQTKTYKAGAVLIEPKQNLAHHGTSSKTIKSLI